MYKLRSVIKHKKGGLDVSVNSIVVLIFAVIILSLGIKFIHDMFGKASASFNQVSKQAKQDIEMKLAQSSSRVVLADNSFTITPGHNVNTYLGIKNYLGKDETFTVLSSKNVQVNPNGEISGGSTIACYYFLPNQGSSQLSSDDLKKFIIFGTVPSILVKAGQSQVLPLRISVANNAKLGLYYCKVYIEDPTNPGQEYATFPFTIEVSSTNNE